MGMPINLFNLLWGIGDEQRPGFRARTHDLKGVRLFVLVVANSRSHPEFCDKLRRDWENLNLGTGRHLLFITPTDPPNTWGSDAFPKRRADRSQPDPPAQSAAEIDANTVVSASLRPCDERPALGLDRPINPVGPTQP